MQIKFLQTFLLGACLLSAFGGSDCVAQRCPRGTMLKNVGDATECIADANVILGGPGGPVSPQ